MADLPLLTGAGLSFVHLNTQSIYNKIDQVRLLVGEMLPDVFCVTESWLTENIPDGLVGISDYTLVRQDRSTGKRGGGLITYFNNEPYSRS